MSRAFVKEEDAETANFIEDAGHKNKMRDWLRIQEKKLDTLLNDPKAKEIDMEKRTLWIDNLKADIANTKAKLTS